MGIALIPLAFTGCSDSNEVNATQKNERLILPITKSNCESLSSKNGISTDTAEMVARKAKISPREVSLWNVKYIDYGATLEVCQYYFDTPIGIKTCWTSIKKEDYKVKSYDAALIKDRGKRGFINVPSCMDFK